MFLGAAITRMRATVLVFIDTFLTMTALGAPSTERVLIVRLDAIGDFILWLDSAQALAAHFEKRGKRPVLLANAIWAQWARDLDFFEEVIAVDVAKFLRSPVYRYRIGSEIRRAGYTTAVEPTFSRSWILGDSIIRVSGARERIGSTGNKLNTRVWQTNMGDSWYTQLVPADPAPRSELERNAEFIRNLGEVDFRSRLPHLAAKSLRVDSQFTTSVGGKPYYVLFPGASWVGRQWPISSFCEIGEKLFDRTGWQGVVCGGPSDFELARDLCQKSRAPLLNWAGRTDLAQLAAILSGTQLLLTNETSAVHIAAACGAPAVCIVGGGHYGRFMPYHVEQSVDRPLPLTVTHLMPCFGCNWKCIYRCPEGNAVPCIERVPVDEVWRSIGEALGFTP
jgi:ADP-heptose:LPS heptosyltransferase